MIRYDVTSSSPTISLTVSPVTAMSSPMVTVVGRERSQSFDVEPTLVELCEPLVDTVELRAVLDDPLRAEDSWDVIDDDEVLLLPAELKDTPAGPECGGSDSFACTHASSSVT